MNKYNKLIDSIMGKNASSRLEVCPKGHVTHTFLKCDARSDCGTAHYVKRCPVGYDTLPSTDTDSTEKDKHYDHGTGFKDKNILRGIQVSFGMFLCEGAASTVHYSLVCDFLNDCADKSDEYFCWHPPCNGFACRNQQCVPTSKRCDGYIHCSDGSDESDCENSASDPSALVEDPSSVIDLDGRGGFRHYPIPLNDSCPDTHYRCPGELPYCLPAYTQCNGYHDCVNGEGEVGCNNVTCPDFYRCLDSPICVHLKDVCDGWPQCPRHDDEWSCERQECPEHCACQGQGLACHHYYHRNRFPNFYNFPNLRYLEISDAITVQNFPDLQNNIYLIFLSLMHCFFLHSNCT